MILWIDFRRKNKEVECVPLAISEEVLESKIREIKSVEYVDILIPETNFSFATDLSKETWIKVLKNRKYFAVREHIREGVFYELCMSKEDVIDILKTRAELGNFAIKMLSEALTFMVEKSEAILIYIENSKVYVMMFGGRQQS